jgi:tetratricopeptide (TPR) repeat protein
MGNTTEALLHHRRSVELNPSIMTLFNMGVTLEENDVDMDEAIAVYERALELDAAGCPTSPPGHFRPMIEEALAEAWEKKNRI